MNLGFPLLELLWFPNLDFPPGEVTEPEPEDAPRFHKSAGGASGSERVIFRRKVAVFPRKKKPEPTEPQRLELLDLPVPGIAAGTGSSSGTGTQRLIAMLSAAGGTTADGRALGVIRVSGATPDATTQRRRQRARLEDELIAADKSLV